MKYQVSIDGRECQVEIVIGSGGSISVKLDGAAVDAEVQRVPGGLVIRRGGRTHDVAIASTGARDEGEEVQLASGAARAIAYVRSERGGRVRSRGRAGGSATELRASMPGRIVRVLCAAGDTVERGQPLVVIEAMKMENELRAPASAKVAAIHVAQGASVEARAVLITFE